MKAINNIFLIGPMGAGKTTVGQMLARKLDKTFYDSDHVVEEQAGVDINWIFDVEQEAGFRRREVRAIAELSQLSNIVLATGGGAITQEESRFNLSARGLVVYLNTPLAAQHDRVKFDQNRPMVRTGDRHQRLLELHQHREPLYQSIADIEFLTDERPPRYVVESILRYLDAL